MLIESHEPKIGTSELIKAYMKIFFGQLLTTTKYKIHNTFLNVKDNIYRRHITIY